MYFEQLVKLKAEAPAWRLLLADHGPLIISFLDTTFLQPGKRFIPQSLLASLLSKFLNDIHQEYPDLHFPKTPKEYLDEWSHDDKGWLRRFYPTEADEVHYDLTAESQRACTWINQLMDKTFIGTQSRLALIASLIQINHPRKPRRSTRKNHNA